MDCDAYPLEEDPNLENVGDLRSECPLIQNMKPVTIMLVLPECKVLLWSQEALRRMRYITYCCHRGGKARTKALKVKAHPTVKTGCQASMNISLHTDGKWILNTIKLEHNHEMCPIKSRYLKFNQIIPPHTKRLLEMNCSAGIRLNKTISSCVLEAKGHEKLTWSEKDARNYMDQVRRSQLKEGDAEAMHQYFNRMREDNNNFFYAMDLDKEHRLCNVFWADARSREAFKEFGDVVTFDTTYLVNKYDMPFAPFVGVNHHGQSILLGCGLVLREDTSSFVWLFETWVSCMFGCSPNAIIIDQCKAMQNAISIVLPNARHHWCLWHILKKIPDKLKGYKDYKSIRYELHNAIYDSLTIGKFEENWANVINKFQLGDNDWLSGLYEEQHRWVPAFVKDNFWAGMSSTQRSESMNAFFDGYVHSNTTLKVFVGQYENALRKKVQKEEAEDARCFNVQLKTVSPYGFEKKFQQAYTIEKFQQFQSEITGKITCSIFFVKIVDCISEYEVREDIQVGESGYLKTVTFHVHFDEVSKESNCTCRLFEYKGIVCKHIVVLWIAEKLDSIPDKYILRRWRKDVTRSHTKVKVSYSNWEMKPEWHRYDILKAAFDAAADKAMYSEAKTERVVAKLREVEVENDVCGDECLVPPISIDVQDSIVSPTDKQKPMGDPIKRRRRGRPPMNRKKPMIEKIIKKVRQSREKTQGSQGKANGRPWVITQESLNFSVSQTRGLHLGLWSYDLNETPIDLEN
ncbi:protein FAR1-RELATED SEQUENCE 5-like [Actinidia eriantha]|uniref:protein FAR1-RELATED SEQUENCE 5-like n=1 Tax=Actinidia eriantha TaxID=165200 RepID=UPI00258FC244|nr:protein FAR1-RELATED SEQUENCE 5-like [Actinidia eriantha]